MYLHAVYYYYQINKGFAPESRVDVMRKVSQEGEAFCERRYCRVIISLPLLRRKQYFITFSLRGIFLPFYTEIAVING